MAVGLDVEMPIEARLSALRAAMEREGLAAYVVPSTDPHQSEYVPPCWQRRAWISGFTGSSGTAVVTRDGAMLWTDSRYWIQALQELPSGAVSLMRSGAKDVPRPEDWLARELAEGDRVGVDPLVLSVTQWKAWQKALADSGVKLTGVEQNLVDEVWSERPPLPSEPAMALSEEFAGRSTAAKLADLRNAMTKARCEAHVVSALDSIAWLLNVRGRDIPCNPLVVSHLVVLMDRLWLFVDGAKLSSELHHHLQGVEVRPYDALRAGIEELGSRKLRVWVDPASTSQSVRQWIADSGSAVHEARSPILLAKAVKNEVELAGMRACHVRDGAAVSRFLRWLEETLARGETPDEVACSDQLLSFRSEYEHFQGISFTTISAYGPNGAIVHYSPERGSCAKLEPSGLYLLDSGAQYLDGTTDITRTVALGPTTDAQREAFTRVLKGHIALATTRFPEGTTGSQLDPMARRPLWEAGLDYGHSTGHGVGHFLCVHEGPVGIAPRSDVSLEVGNILSNEPGYYEADAFGIRLENLVEVVDAGVGAADTRFLGFATITQCPIDRRCIDADALTPAERTWVDDYHRRVRDEVMPLLDDARDQQWLERATAPL